MPAGGHLERFFRIIPAWYFPKDLIPNCEKILGKSGTLPIRSDRESRVMSRISRAGISSG
jgi:hypothetical protein